MILSSINVHDRQRQNNVDINRLIIVATEIAAHARLRVLSCKRQGFSNISYEYNTHKSKTYDFCTNAFDIEQRLTFVFLGSYILRNNKTDLKFLKALQIMRKRKAYCYIMMRRIGFSEIEAKRCN